MWLLTNNIDSHSIEWELMLINVMVLRLQYGLEIIFKSAVSAPFDNMRTLKFKAQPTNAFFTTVNQMFGGSSQLPTTAERAVIKSNR